MEDDPVADNPASTGLTTADGISLFCRWWTSPQSPRAALAVVHGLGEHSGRYERLGQHFSRRLFSVFAVDLRGHGRSAGKRGHINQFSDYHHDVQVLIDFAHQETPDVPIFLLGHSLGGLITLHYALHHPDGLASVITSGAALRETIHPPFWKVMLGKMMSALYPDFSLQTGLKVSALCHDQAVIDAYVADPLVHDRVTARFYREYLLAAAWTLEEAVTLSLPALLLHGERDALTDPAGSHDFYERIGLEDKRYLAYPGLYHEIFNEPSYEEIFNDIEAWLVPRL
ncbi:MAG: alpha/beta hydrolase [Anaerolineae bacterium]